MRPPIACTLQPDELADRRTELAEIGREALRSRRPIPGGERLSFAPGTRTEARVRAAVAAEAVCCAFLRMDLHLGPDALLLDVTGPDEAQPLIGEMFT